MADKHLVALISLDSSAAFDTIDHRILLNRLESEFYITGDALKWIESYLKDRTFAVKINESTSDLKRVRYGVPQGSQLGPLFYILYTKEIESIVHSYGFEIQMYADDVQLYISFTNNIVESMEENLRNCLKELKKWMDNSYLKLNEEKTQFTVFYPHCISSLSEPLKLRIFNQDDTILISNEIKILGVKLTKTLNFSSFISDKVQACYFHLRNFNYIKKSLPVSIRITLVTSIIISKLDYCNALLVGTTEKDIKPLQRMLNKVVRFIFNIRRREHIRPYLFKLHFLPIRFRINFKVCLLAFKIKRKIAPEYLIDSFQDYQSSTSISLRYGLGRDQSMFQYLSIFLNDSLLFVKLVSNWNKLPFFLRQIQSLTEFKSKLKSHFFRLAYPDLISTNS